VKRPSPGVETKVAVQAATTLISWFLVADVPALHNGIPTDARGAIAAGVGLVFAYFAPHTPRGEYAKLIPQPALPKTTAAPPSNVTITDPKTTTGDTA
jgi:hypothetical protein